MRADKIKELVWLRRNRDKLTEEENQLFKKLGVFDFIQSNHIKLNLYDFIFMLYELDAVIDKYSSDKKRQKKLTV